MRKGKPRKTPPKKLEHNEQVKFVRWFREKYPHVLIFAIPNGAKFSSGPMQWSILKAEGAVAGIPDLMIPGWKVVIEMKRPEGGVVSEEQSRLLDYFESIGWSASVCEGFDKAKLFIEKIVRRMPPAK